MPTWRLFALPGALLCLLYPFLDESSASSVYLGVSLAGLGALAAGIRVHRPEHPAPWWFLTAGTACLHSWVASGQRGWNTQPDGGLSGLGSSPLMIVRGLVRSMTGSGMGAAASSAFV